MMSDIDPSRLNIFTPAHDGTFNSCIGTNSMHDMRTYAEGYLQASQQLLDAIFNQHLMFERDTLVHPILYAARHGIELSIKHVLIKLNECDIKTDERLIHGHELKNNWLLFEKTLAFDRQLMSIVEGIKPIVYQLDEADPNAQGFRYPIDTDDKQTLDGKVIVDLITVKKLVDYLKEKIISLFFLVDKLVDERQLGAFTKELNRDELQRLSLELPDYEAWADGEEFGIVKQRLLSDLSLNNSAFSRGVTFIKQHHEFAGNIGIESDFIAINEDVLRNLMDESMSIRKEDIADRDLPLLERIKKRPHHPAYDVYEKVKEKLDGAAVAELRAIFEISSGLIYSECFDVIYKRNLCEFTKMSGDALEEGIKQSFIHVFSKTGFIDGVICGLKKIGKSKLADDFNKYILKVDIKLDSFEELMELK